MGATVKRLAQVRVMLIGIAIMLCLVFDLTFARWLSFKWGCMVLDVLGDVSAILFGVFGVWLGMFYSPTIIDSLKEKSGDNLRCGAEIHVRHPQRQRLVIGQHVPLDARRPATLLEGVEIAFVHCQGNVLLEDGNANA